MNWLGALLVMSIVLGACFLPTIVGASRRLLNIGSVAVVKVFLGWTFIAWTFIGWMVAMPLAMRTDPSRACSHCVAPGATALPPGAAPAGWYDDPHGEATPRWRDGQAWTGLSANPR